MFVLVIRLKNIRRNKALQTTNIAKKLRNFYICRKSQAMLEDFRLKVFITVAREGSFTKAAAVLGVTQPAVSQNIADLEKMISRKLFERLRGEVVLTPQGKVFMTYAKEMLSLCDAVGNVFDTFTPSVVKISASEELYVHFIAPALESFIAIHNEITFERSIFDDADLAVNLSPSSDSPFEIHPDSISRLRISSGPVPKMGDYKATQEKTLYFDVLFQPSPAFACTRLCRVLKTFLTSF